MVLVPENLQGPTSAKFFKLRNFKKQIQLLNLTKNCFLIHMEK